MGNMGLAPKVVGTFLRDTPKRIEQIRHAVRTDNAADLEFHAHTLKGSAAMLGGMEVSHAAADLVKAARNGDLSKTDLLIDNLDMAYAQLAEVMKTIL